jgi:uncharacterized protein Yka (UPF0111/DUF47 family)
MQIEPKSECKQLFAIMDKIVDLGKECAYCEMFFRENVHEDNDWKMLKLHLLIAHKDQAREVDESLLAEMR